MDRLRVTKTPHAVIDQDATLFARYRLGLIGWGLLLLFFTANPAGSRAASTPGNHAPGPDITEELGHTGLFPQWFQDGMQAYNDAQYAEALWLWRPLAENGHIQAQYNLGVAYARGLGVPEDMSEAGLWWKRAAQQGSTDAQYNLGLLYAKGAGVDQDLSLAADWWRQAAVGGDAVAQYNLGMMYARGEGVQRNINTAIQWWRTSAALGFVNAQTLLEELASDEIIKAASPTIQ